MNELDQHASLTADKTRIEQAEARIEQAEARTEQAKAQTEQAKALAEQAKAQIEQAKARTEQAEARTEQAKSRAESAETRAENAEIRTEQAKTRIEQAETCTEQAKSRAESAETRAENAEKLAGKTLPWAVQRDIDLPQGLPTQLLKDIPGDEITTQKSPLKQLTSRQREILKLIAEGRNTKQIADILNVSPKTVEYHRIKLMDCLNIRDVPGLVRFALRVGLILPES